MPQVWNKWKRLSVHITPRRRAEQLPNEFTVKGNQLYCRWCDKTLTSLRMDNIRLHLTSSLHKDNKIQKGAPLTDDNVKKKGPRSRYVPPRVDAYRYSSEDGSSSDDSSDDEDEEPDGELSQLFEDSDAETEAFQGFDDDSLSTDEEQSFQQHSRAHKRSLHFDDSVERPKKRRKRQRSSLEDGSPIPFRSMPLKKQMSYEARNSQPMPRKKAKLKIKICRQSNNTKAFQVESTDEDDLSPDKRKVASSRRSRDGLKMKFVLNKEQNQQQRRSPGKHQRAPRNYSSDEIQRYPREDTNLISPSRSEQEVEYDHHPNVFEGVEELIEEEVVSDGVEVVEEEIVGIDDDEVVSWDAVVGDEEVVEEEVVASPETPPQPEPELTSEESLALKANYAREMAKAVNSAQFKKKRLIAKKQEPKLEEKEKQKRKVSAYNLWSSKMRRQVATQYPGLQFGEVSKKLGNLWKKIPEKEKQLWKHRSDKMANKLEEIQTNTTKRNKGSRMIETGPKKKPAVSKPQPRPVPLTPFTPHKNPEQAMKRELQRLPAPSIEPMDAAAHFRLLGQSLMNMAKQVKTVRNSPHVNKALPLLLDGLLCSLSPLLSVTNQIPQLEGSMPDTSLVSIYCNNAHIMPGF